MAMTTQQDTHLSKVLSPPTDSVSEKEHKRLWIGNLDPKVSEYYLLKLLQKHGTIEKFDVLLHRSGPQAGQPRGYAFCTYATVSDAAVAKNSLDGRVVGTNRISVNWAYTMTKDEMEGKKPDLNIPVLAGANSEKTTKRPLSRQTTIQAIEAKLKMMEHKNQTEEFEIGNSPAAFRPKPHPLLIAQSHSDQHSKPTHSRHTYRNHNRKPYQYKP